METVILQATFDNIKDLSAIKKKKKRALSEIKTKNVNEQKRHRSTAAIRK